MLVGEGDAGAGVIAAPHPCDAAADAERLRHLLALDVEHDRLAELERLRRHHQATAGPDVLGLGRTPAAAANQRNRAARGYAR